MKIRLFIDSDVIISSLISSKGAARLLINEPHIERFVSNISKKELAIVVKRLGLEQIALKKLLSTRCKSIIARESLATMNLHGLTSVVSSISRLRRVPSDDGSNRHPRADARGFKIGNIKENFGQYRLDENDAHIIAGAAQAKVKFLVSYNIRDFKREKIKKDFDIIMATPAQMLQYLRSVS